ncbi:FliH/SctL family protein [Sphingomonas sp.]|uniref:FliH/SctL family protein n=1 Tax=Sphingomonas sp. TaxID=28214 RepID=UPI0025EC8D7C|nr:FliH/SctL family protein [Sphingomonas sp.]
MDDGFAAGLPTRADAGAAARLAASSAGFTPIDLAAAGSAPTKPLETSETFTARPIGPKSFKPEGAKPKHFKPAEPDDKAADTWDPRDADSGFEDPIARARAAGFAEGLAHAEALAAQHMDAHAEQQAGLVAGIAAALSSPERIDRERLAQQLRDAVILLARQLVGEVGVAPERMAGRIKAAADMIADTAEAAVLRVHPDDAALLKEHLPPTLFPIADNSVARGHFVLESAATIVEEGPELWFDQLSAAIERVPLPSC